MRFGEAEAFISRCRQSTKKLAALAVGALLGKASLQGLRVGRCGMLSASGRALPPLRDILQSHALIHAAEGEFYRDATAAACAAAEVAVLRIRERDALQQAADAAGSGEAEIRDWLATIGKELGPPWTEDQKLAVLASWIALL